MAETEGWQRVAALTDIAQGEPFGAKYGEHDIVLASHDGKVYALAGICPHAYALMCDGFMNGAEIECPLHAAAFDIHTGKCLSGPDGTGDLATYEVRIEGADVLVRPSVAA
jgi:3-phenylpropionate/trans-cinnamate dioxygenase ferredoxin subunit